MIVQAVEHLFYTAQPHTNTRNTHLVDSMVKRMFEMWRPTCQELCLELCWCCPMRRSYASYAQCSLHEHRVMVVIPSVHSSVNSSNKAG